MFLLDTDTLSELEKPKPKPGLLEWLDSVDWLKLHLSVITRHFAVVTHNRKDMARTGGFVQPRNAAKPGEALPCSLGGTAFR